MLPLKIIVIDTKTFYGRRRRNIMASLGNFSKKTFVPQAVINYMFPAKEVIFVRRNSHVLSSLYSLVFTFKLICFTIVIIVKINKACVRVLYTYTVE